MRYMFVNKKQFEDLKEIIKKFKVINKSPFSESFYDREVDFGEKPEGTIRISKHWNYKSSHDDEVHAVTDKGVKDDNWAVGVYKNGVYEIVWELDKEYHINTIRKLRKEVEEDDFIEYEAIYVSNNKATIEKIELNLFPIAGNDMIIRCY